MSFLPQVISARYLGGHRILVRFNDGTEAALDFRKWLRGPVFEPLQDLDQFRRFFVEGGGVAWPIGADMAPETLYADAHAGRRDDSLKPAKARKAPRAKPASRRRHRG